MYIIPIPRYHQLPVFTMNEPVATIDNSRRECAECLHLYDRDEFQRGMRLVHVCRACYLLVLPPPVEDQYDADSDDSDDESDEE